MFSDISIDSLEGSCLFLGQPGSRLRDIRLANIDFTLHHRNPLADNRKPRGTKSLREEASNDFSTEAASFVFAHVEGLDIRGLSLMDRSDIANHERRVLWGLDVHRVSVRELSTRQASPNETMPVMRFEDSSMIEVSSCSPGSTAAAFVEVDATTERVALHNNNVESVASVFRADTGFDDEQVRLRHNLGQ